MRGYGQFYPIAKASEVLVERLTHLILRELGVGSETFTDLRKGLPLMSPSLLSHRLKSLEAGGIVHRRTQGERVRHGLTRADRELIPIILQLGSWGHRWVRSDLSQHDLDPGLLIWYMHRNMNAGFFTAPRTVIKVEFTDILTGKRFWWLVVSKGDADVCLKDPGYDVDLTVSSDLRTLTAIWIGDTSFMKAMRAKQVRVTGSAQLRKNIPAWPGTSYFADVKTAV